MTNHNITVRRGMTLGLMAAKRFLKNMTKREGRRPIDPVIAAQDYRDIRGQRTKRTNFQ